MIFQCLCERIKRFVIKQEQALLHEYFFGSLACSFQNEAGAITADNFHCCVDQVAAVLGDSHVQRHRFAAVPRV